MYRLRKTTATLLIAIFLVSIIAIVAPVYADNIIEDNSPWSYIEHSMDWNPFAVRYQDVPDRPRELSVVISDLSVSGDLYVGNTLTLSGIVDMTADPGIHVWWYHEAVACSYGDAKLTHEGTLLGYAASPLKWALCDAGDWTSYWYTIIPNDQSQTWDFSFDFTPTEAGIYTLKAFGHVDASYYRYSFGPGYPSVSWYDSDNQADSITFEVRTPLLAKEYAIDELNALKPMCDDKLDKKIDKAIDHIEKSLDDKCWVDGSHLDPKHGNKVFDEEKKAVKELEHIIKDKHTLPDTKDKCQEVIEMLVKSDKSLAETVYDEASTFAGDSKVDKELDKCDKEFEKAQKELDHTKKDGTPDPHYDKAIDHYKKAWKHAQHALKHVT